MSEPSKEAVDICRELYDMHIIGGYEPPGCYEFMQKALDAARNQAFEDAAMRLDPDMLGQSLCDAWRENIRTLKSPPIPRKSVGGADTSFYEDSTQAVCAIEEATPRGEDHIGDLGQL